MLGATLTGIIARLGLPARITILDLEMVGLDRVERAIALSDGRQLNYDFLLITCGVQEQTANTFAQVCAYFSVHGEEARVSM